ncbi:MAG: VWA domain-containing protein [Victivallales bacterium]
MRNKAKNEHAVEIASLLAFSAIRNNDKVGLLIFTDRTELYLPPRSGKTHGLRLIRELLARKPKGKGTDIAAALNNLMHMLNKRAVVFLISDFMDDKDFSKRLMIANKRHDVIAVRILDPAESKWPGTSSISLEDSENGRILDLFIPGKIFSDGFARRTENIRQANETVFKRAKVDLIDILCGDDFVKPLVKFFRQREQFGR